MVKAYICGKFPSLNEYIAACRGNRYAGAAMKKEAEELVMWQLTRLQKIDKPVHITFTWYEMNKKRDKDNVAFAKKFILDALQKVGVLPNDNNRYIAGFTDLFVYGHGVGVEIEIEVVENEHQ